ncbi:phosphatase PAP2 family protein [Thermococcus sp.]
METGSKREILWRYLRPSLLLATAYLYWAAYSFLYPLIGRWALNYTDLLLRLPGTSRTFVLSLLTWTEAHHSIYRLMDALYAAGFTWVLLGAFLYLLYRDPKAAERAAGEYLLGFLSLSLVFSLAYVLPPHMVYPNLPRHYSPPGWQARPQFVLPSPHCTVDTISFLALTEERHRVSKLLALLVGLIPLATVLLAEHWVWDAVSGILLGWLVNRYSGKVFNSTRKGS